MRPLRTTATTTFLTPVVVAAVIAGGALTAPAAAEHQRLPGGRHLCLVPKSSQVERLVARACLT